MNNLLLKKLAVSQKGLNNRLLSALEILIVRTMNKILNASTFISWLLNSVIDSRCFDAVVMELKNLQQRKLVTEPVKKENRCRKFVKLGVKGNLAQFWYCRKVANNHPPLSSTTIRAHKHAQKSSQSRFPVVAGMT